VAGPVKATEVLPESVSWLWRNRIPKGMISLVAGKPDQGKGLFAAHLAAEVSVDKTVRDGGGRVLYSAAEDSHGLMTRPRLEAAGANLDNVLLWRFALPKNGRELGEIVVNEGIDLMVMDPLASHLSGGISRHSDNVRQVLSPLIELIESTGTAVLIIEHALKRVPKSGHPLDAIGGSGSGVPAASRTAFVFGRDPDDMDRRILAPAKFNIGPLPKALAFDVDVEDLDTVGEVPLLVVDEEMMAFDPMRLFESKTQPGKVGRPPDKRAAAAEWLTTYLADAGGPVKASAIQEDAKQYGMAAKTLRRAAEDMSVVKAPPGGGRNCTWDLPDEVKELMGLLPPADAPTGDQPTEPPVKASDVPPPDDDLEITDDDLSQLLGEGE
jgi:putative DNA primase/helicase